MCCSSPVVFIQFCYLIKTQLFYYVLINKTSELKDIYFVFAMTLYLTSVYKCLPGAKRSKF